MQKCCELMLWSPEYAAFLEYIVTVSLIFINFAYNFECYNILSKQKSLEFFWNLSINLSLWSWPDKINTWGLNRCFTLTEKELKLSKTLIFRNLINLEVKDTKSYDFSKSAYMANDQITSLAEIKIINYVCVNELKNHIS